jgi:hypothetical protein
LLAVVSPQLRNHCQQGNISRDSKRISISQKKVAVGEGKTSLTVLYRDENFSINSLNMQTGHVAGMKVQQDVTRSYF